MTRLFIKNYNFNGVEIMDKNFKKFLLNDAIKMRKKDIIFNLINNFKLKPKEALEIYNDWIKMWNKN